MPARIELSDEAILKALVEARGNAADAARRLGVSPQTIGRRLAANPALAEQGRAVRPSESIERLRPPRALLHAERSYIRPAQVRRLSEAEAVELERRILSDFPTPAAPSG